MVITWFCRTCSSKIENLYGSSISNSQRLESLPAGLPAVWHGRQDSKVEFLGFNSWFFFNMCTISIPAIVLFADSNKLLKKQKPPSVKGG